jgi:hypothetical protein
MNTATQATRRRRSRASRDRARCPVPPVGDETGARGGCALSRGCRETRASRRRSASRIPCAAAMTTSASRSRTHMPSRPSSIGCSPLAGECLRRVVEITQDEHGALPRGQLATGRRKVPSPDPPPAQSEERSHSSTSIAAPLASDTLLVPSKQPRHRSDRTRHDSATRRGPPLRVPACPRHEFCPASATGITPATRSGLE